MDFSHSNSSWLDSINIFDDSSVCQEYSNQQKLGKNEGIEFYLCWEINNSKEQIYFKIQAKTTGWISIGFSPKGKMKESDSIIGWISSNGLQHLEDRFIVQYTEPILDTKLNPPGTDDVLLHSMNINNG